MDPSYVCSKNVSDYQHFGEAQGGKCPLHDSIEARHEQEVKKAAEEAMAKVRADNPGLSDADLMIKVSDRVKQAEDARKSQGAADANAFPYRMVGNVLHRAIPAGVGAQPAVPPPPQFARPAAQYVPPPPYAIAHLPVLVQPVRPVEFGHPFGYMGPAPQQQPPQYAFHRPFAPADQLPLVPACPRCYMYHPPNQRC